MLKYAILGMGFLALFNLSGNAGEIIRLLPPRSSGGKSIMECLSLRRSIKEFKGGKELSLQQLSELLYAAGGVNRPDGRLTIPTARNLQNQRIYVALKDGIYIYESKDHVLKLLRPGNFIAQCGRQSYHRNAAVELIYAADLPIIGGSAEGQAACGGTHAGSSAQNVYLYAASEGLGTVICGNFDRKKLTELLKLEKNWRIFYVQPVGFPVYASAVGK